MQRLSGRNQSEYKGGKESERGWNVTSGKRAGEMEVDLAGQLGAVRGVNVHPNSSGKPPEDCKSKGM